MAADIEETHAPAHVPPLCHLHQHHHLPLSHHHIPFPPFFHRHHHYQLPPRPFLCARCKCWNFFANPSFNPNPNHQHRSHLQQGDPHVHHPNPHDVESAEFLKDQELTEVDHQAENSPSNRCVADEMEEVEEEDYEFVMTDEWIEFFAKSEARREEKKRQQKKAARDLRKATRARSQVEEPSQHIDEECATS